MKVTPMLSPCEITALRQPARFGPSFHALAGNQIMGSQTTSRWMGHCVAHSRQMLGLPPLGAGKLCHNGRERVDLIIANHNIGEPILLARTPEGSHDLIDGTN